MTFRSRSSASRPASAADLDVVGLGVGRAGRIRRRQADHEQAARGELGRLGQRLREGELRFEGAGRQVALVVQLPRVGHPLVDQDQTGAVVVEERPQRIAGIGGMGVVVGDAGERLLPPQLPGQLAPQRADHGPVGFRDRVARRDLVADQHDPSDGRHLDRAGIAQHRVDAGQIARRRAGEKVVQGEHRVGLAAAEVRLELYDRVAGSAAEALHGARQHALQAFGQVRAPEELDRIAVLVSALAQVHLPEIGRKLGLLVLPTRHVAVRRDDLPPGRQGGGGGAVDGEARLLPPLAPRLLVEADAQQLHLEAVDALGLGSRHRRQQAVRRVEDAVGVVAGERFLMGPAVPVSAQLPDESALCGPENRAEDLVPGLPHQLEQACDVPLGDRAAADPRIVHEPEQGLRIHPVSLDRPLDLTLDERSESGLQEIEGLADPLVVGGSHQFFRILRAAPRSGGTQVL